jgi:hypothetical protein
VSYKVAILVMARSSGLVGRSRLTMKGEGEIITTHQKSATTSGTMEFREKEGGFKGYTTRSVFRKGTSRMISQRQTQSFYLTCLIRNFLSKFHFQSFHYQVQLFESRSW